MVLSFNLCEILEIDLDLGCEEREGVSLLGMWEDGTERERRKQSINLSEREREAKSRTSLPSVGKKKMNSNLFISTSPIFAWFH